jgi:phospholipid/cholesterol/gamma-HCH transport system ATP-binding protein
MTPTADAAPIVVMRDVSRKFGTKVVLDHMSLVVLRGETLVLLGRSGSGKSVTLKLLTGLIAPDDGEIRVDGEPVTGRSERELAPIRRKIGMVFQGGALFDSLSVAENVGYGLAELLRWPEEKIRERVRECLELVDLPGIDKLRPDELSGGMKKRVAVARAIATSPEILLYDEPTTGLDPATSEHVIDLIRAMQLKLGITSIVVTHDLAAAFGVADRLALLENGKIAWTIPLEEARTSPPEALVEFLGGQGSWIRPADWR